MPVLKNIYRYPIKGLSAQPLTRRRHCRPRSLSRIDRIFALVRPGAPFDIGQPRWGKKGLFVMLMLEEAIGAGQDCAGCRNAETDDHAGQSATDSSPI